MLRLDRGSWLVDDAVAAWLRGPTLGLVPDRPARFLTLPEVAEELATSMAQVTALVRRGELLAIKLGGRGQWRVERSKLGGVIERCY